MTKVRIYELAKKMGLSNHELLTKLKAQGIQAKTHSSNIDEKIVEKILNISKETNTNSKELNTNSHINEHAETNISNKELKLKKEDNVVRNINPSAIKTRLAADSRVFKNQNSNNSIPNNRKYSSKRKIYSTNKINNENNKNYAFKTNGKKTNFTNNLFNEKINKNTELLKQKKIIKINDLILVGDLAKKMSIKVNKVVSKLIELGMMISVNQYIDFDTAIIIAEEFGFHVENISFKEEDILNINKINKNIILKTRSPIVTIMGHVNHGKTTLLNVFRDDFNNKEIGDITQHIGAYRIKVKDKYITIIDTPGHESFSSMRSRGANATDIVILVVAANDGVMPQTIESINHAQEAGAAIIVAINKIDLPSLQTEKIMQSISKYNIVPEAWGGDTQFFHISAKKKKGIDNLLEGILTQAEIMDLKSDFTQKAYGIVIESRIDKGLGVIATILIKSGSLNKGDSILAGTCTGKIRAILNDRNKVIETAFPSMPVQILGLSSTPIAGDTFHIIEDEKSAKLIISHRIQKDKNKKLKNINYPKIQTPSEININTSKKLKFIIKSDVSGSLSVIINGILNIIDKEIYVKFIHTGVGDINLSDINHAIITDAILIGFNVKSNAQTQNIAKEKKIKIYIYDIIYNLFNYIKSINDEIMRPVDEIINIGIAVIKKIFINKNKKNIYGTYVTEGKIITTQKVNIKRDGKLILQTHILNIRRFKDDVKEINSGYECGITLDKDIDIKIGDIIECIKTNS